MLYQAYDYFSRQLVDEGNNLDKLLSRLRKTNCFSDIVVKCNMDNTVVWASSLV